MAAADNRAIVERTFEVFNSGDFDGIDAYVAPDFYDHNPPPGTQGHTMDAVKQTFRMMRAAVPDLRIEVEDIVAEGDKVAVRASFLGTHQDELMGIPGTGKQLRVGSIHIFRVANGKLAEHWAAQDELGMLQQLGVVPAPGQ